MAKTTVKTKSINTDESWCIRDGKLKFVDDFYKSPNPSHHSGYLPYCKLCCKKIFDEYLEKTGAIEPALWFTCAEVGIPFIMEAWERLQKLMVETTLKYGRTPKDYNYIGNYVKALFLGNGAVTIKKNFSDTDVVYDAIESAKKTEEAVKKDAEKFELDWGKQTVDDYSFLEYRYSTYTDGISLTPSQEADYRALCLLELSKRKKDEKNEDVKSELDSIAKLKKTLKIDNYNNDSDKPFVQRMLEYQIWEMENTEPAELEDLKTYQDMCSLDKNWWGHILRAMKNLLTGSREYPRLDGEEKI
jgi:hypothetical protein